VFWVTTDGTTATLRAFDATTGSQVAAITLPTNSTARPIVANGQVYIADGTSITALALP
jgi:outer membrane protein assembly factor BamB